MLETYEAARNRVRILLNEKLYSCRCRSHRFLQGKVDAVLRAQRIEEEMKRQFAPPAPPKGNSSGSASSSYTGKSAVAETAASTHTIRASSCCETTGINARIQSDSIRPTVHKRSASYRAGIAIMALYRR